MSDSRRRLDEILEALKSQREKYAELYGEEEQPAAPAAEISVPDEQDPALSAKETVAADSHEIEQGESGVVPTEDKEATPPAAEAKPVPLSSSDMEAELASVNQMLRHMNEESQPDDEGSKAPAEAKTLLSAEIAKAETPLSKSPAGEKVIGEKQSAGEAARAKTPQSSTSENREQSAPPQEKTQSSVTPLPGDQGVSSAPADAAAVFAAAASHSGQEKTTTPGITTPQQAQTQAAGEAAPSQRAGENKTTSKPFVVKINFDQEFAAPKPEQTDDIPPQSVQTTAAETAKAKVQPVHTAAIAEAKADGAELVSAAAARKAQKTALEEEVPALSRNEEVSEQLAAPDDGSRPALAGSAQDTATKADLASAPAALEKTSTPVTTAPPQAQTQTAAEAEAAPQRVEESKTAAKPFVVKINFDEEFPDEPANELPEVKKEAKIVSANENAGLDSEAVSADLMPSDAESDAAGISAAAKRTPSEATAEIKKKEEPAVATIAALPDDGVKDAAAGNAEAEKETNEKADSEPATYTQTKDSETSGMAGSAAGPAPADNKPAFRLHILDLDADPAEKAERTAGQAAGAGLAAEYSPADQTSAAVAVAAKISEKQIPDTGKQEKIAAAALKVEKITRAEPVVPTDQDGLIKTEKNYPYAEEEARINGLMALQTDKQHKASALALKRKRGKLVVSLLAGILSLLAATLLFALSGTKTIGGQHVSVVVAVQVGLLIFNAGINWKLFLSAVKGVFARGRFSAHVPALLSVLGALIHDLVVLAAREQLFGSVWVYTPIALFCILTSLACEIADLSGKIACLEYLDQAEDGVSLGIARDGELAREITQRAFGDEVQAAVPIRRAKVTDMLGGGTDSAYSVLHKGIPVLALAAALAVFFIKLAQGVGVFAGLSAFSCVLCICSPAMFALCTSFGTYKAVKSLIRSGSMIAGYDAAMEFVDLDALVVDQTELFAKDEVQLQGIKMFGDNRIDDAILLCASVLANTGGPLYKSFLRMIDNRTEILLDLKNLVYEEGMGYAAWFEGGRRVLIGNAALMESHDILLPVEDYEAKLGKTGKKVMYVADRGRLIAFFVAEYQFKPQYRRYAKQLDKYAITLLVKGYDPNIDQQMLERMFGAPEKQVRLVSKAASDYYEDHVVPPQTVAAGAYTTSGLTGMVKLVLMCEKLRSTVFAAHFFAIASCVFGAFLSVISNASGMFYEMSTWQALVYQLIWTLPALAFFFLKGRE